MFACAHNYNTVHILNSVMKCGVIFVIKEEIFLYPNFVLL